MNGFYDDYLGNNAVHKNFNQPYPLMVVPVSRKHRYLLAKSIRARRKELGYNQEKLAENANLSSIFISRVERGVESPRLTNLVKIANALKIKVNELIKF